MTTKSSKKIGQSEKAVTAEPKKMNNQEKETLINGLLRMETIELINNGGASEVKILKGWEETKKTLQQASVLKGEEKENKQTIQ
jgi:hypothetical protein